MRNLGFGLLGALLLVVTLFGLVVLDGNAPPSSPPASAEPSGPTIRDSDFLKALGGQVTSVSPAVAEGMARRVCSALDEGTPVDEVRKVLVQKGVTPAESSRITLAAVTMYCAENKDKVMR
jgi:hypothetical protein